MKKLLLYVLAAVAAGCIAILFSACAPPPAENSISVPQNLAIDEEEYLVWDEVPEADGYLVEIDGESYEAKTPKFDLFDICDAPADYAIKVYAKKGESQSQPAEISHTIKTSDCLTFTYNKGFDSYEIKATDPTKVEGKIIIPDIYDGKLVTRVAAEAFQDCTKLTGIIMPYSILEVGNGAFQSCTSLTRVHWSENTPKVYTVFRWCSKLQKIDFPEGVESISGGAFENCENLKEIGLPATLKNLFPGTFLYCERLEKFKLAEGNTVYKVENNCLIDVANNSILAGGISVDIPDYIESIGRGAFSGRNIESVTVPSNVKKIEGMAFSACKKLTSVTLCEGLEEIGTAVFGCRSLTALHIPATVKKIVPSIGLTWTTALTVAEGNPVYKSEGNCIMTKADNVLVQGCYSSKVPQGVTAIGENAFQGSNFSTIDLPEGIKTIGEGAFSGSELIEIAIPYGCLEIGESAVSTCLKLEELYLPKGLTTIRYKAFYNCDNLHEVVIPETVTVIEEDAFYTIIPVILHTPLGLDNLPEGWANKLGQLRGGADIIYDGYYPYLNSIKKVNYDERNYGYFSKNDNVACVFRRKGYKFKGLTTEEGGTVAEYGMKYKEGFLFVHPLDPNIKAYIYEHYYCAFTADEWDKYPDGTHFYTIWEKK